MAEEDFYGGLLARLHAHHYQGHASAAAAKLHELLGERQPAVVVDLGCGSGDLLASFARPGARLLGVDLSPALLAYAAERVPGAELLEASIYEAELPASMHLLCAVGEVVQYGPDPRAGLAGLSWLCTLASERLIPGGLLAFDLVTPGRAGPTGARSFTRRHAEDLEVGVEASEEGPVLTRTITTRSGGRVEVERHVQETVDVEEARAQVAASGLEVVYLAADYAGTPISTATSSVAVVARRA